MRPILLALFLALASPEPAAGQPAEPERAAKAAAIPADASSREDVGEDLEYAEHEHDAAIDPPGILLDPLNRARGVIDDRLGLRIGLAYTGLYQKATSGNGRRESAGLGSLDVFGKWHIVGRWIAKDTANDGYLGFAVDQRHRYTDVAPGNLGDEIGSQWDTTDGFRPRGQLDTAWKQLWWEQHLFDDAVTVTVGKVDPTNYYDGNRVSNANLYFANFAFSFNPASPAPDQGLGVNINVAPTDDFYVSLGFHDANATPTSSGFRSIDEGEFFYGFEVGATPDFGDGVLGRGNYRLHGFYSSRASKLDIDSGAGVSLSVDQELWYGDRLVFVPFLRYGHETEGSTDTRQVLSFGVGASGWFEKWDDVAGIAFAWGQPRKRPRRHQYVSEFFYRFQLTPTLTVTPSYQVIYQPSRNRNRTVVGVFGIRFRVTL